MANLANKTALITGASRGIGRAAALALAAAGAQIFVHYGRSAKEADDVVSEITRNGGRAQALGADMTDPTGPHTLAQQVRALTGRLDILVANAGISRHADIASTTPEDFDELFAVNVRAPFFLIQQLLPILADGSSIVITSSVVAHTAIDGLAAYAMTKGALDTMVKHFAWELGPRNIRVNAVAPGIVDTDMSGFSKTETGRNYALNLQALKRIAQPHDISSAITFLASEDSRWITGHTLAVDGGTKI